MNKAILTLSLLAFSFASLGHSPTAIEGETQMKQNLQRENTIAKTKYVFSKKFRRRLC